jgi:hypothetical protein
VSPMQTMRKASTPTTESPDDFAFMRQLLAQVLV